jgi:TolB-like protein/Flp pilus assembly protein TadD/predicted Ser/Thr protein kinase
MIEFRAVQDGERIDDSPVMSSVLRVCRKCGAEIFADTPEGLCTACLFETGLALLAPPSVAADDSSAVASAKADDCVPVEDVESSNANAAPHVKKAPRPTKTLADFGDYELLEEIGRGGQGVVYRARQKSLNRTVALKVIGLGHWATEAHLKRFRREAEAAASLEHPGIVPIHEVGERDGSCYFSMKFIEGGQLDAVAKREAMPVRRAVELIAKVARTIHHAHERGILHRDIKPGNILVDQKGEPHLTDFGLARLVETESTVTRTMEVLGTPSYMAPEQAVGNNAAVSSVTDVYGLGAVLYQLLTAHPPFAGGTTYETIRLVLDTEPRQPRLWNPKIDRDLSTICLKCLEKDPKRRYSSALALAEDLERWIKHEPILARRTGVFTRGRKWMRRNPTSALLAASLVALAAAAGWIVWKTEFIRQPVTTGIAVLPFENLSDEKEHAFFADGVQDDILTKLAKVADLKVISRTSVMKYRGKQDVRQIGDALRVSHVLEGTVRRFGGKVHVNAQLVDTRTDAGIWAEEYDRNLNDVFAIETEVAQSIANRLRARVSAREKVAMQEWPTRDLVAYDLYVQATPLIEGAGFALAREEKKKDYFQAIELLNQAIARDPAFLLAYCWLARAHDAIYLDDLDHTSGRLALAKSAIDSAFRLKPDSGEAHLALALHLYWGYFDYDRARAELAIAQRALPNNPRVFEFTGYIDRRQGRWSDAVRSLERASELDPRNTSTLTGVVGLYFFLRAYQQAGDAIDRLLVLEPNDIRTKLSRGWLEIARRADTRPMHAAIEKILADNPTQVENEALKGARFYLALLERDFVAAGRAAEALPEISGDEFAYSRAFGVGVAARMKGDTAAARVAFSVARADQETLVRARPDSGPYLSALGAIDAALGRKEEALREGRRAVELTPVAKDTFIGPMVVSNLALIYAWTGERDLAIEQLEIAVKLPAGPDYGDLRLNPMWDSLRGDPKFEKIVASLAPKDSPKQVSK